MLTYTCPKGHSSTEADYCSECGTKIQGVLDTEADLVPSSLVPISAIVCPDCSTPHESSSGKFCEICGYNFVTGAHGEVPGLEEVETPTPIAIAPSLGEGEPTVKQPQSLSSGSRLPVVWELHITIDPALALPESPPAPNQALMTVSLQQPVNLIGRTSTQRAIAPEVALDFDSAVSHRHALLTQQADGTWSLRDIGSSNGTFVNGQEIAAMVDVPLHDGDEFTLGHWTRIQLVSLQS